MAGWENLGREFSTMGCVAASSAAGVGGEVSAAVISFTAASSAADCHQVHSQPFFQ